MSTTNELPRDLAILHHVARYRIGLNEVLSRLFFAGKDAGRVVGLLTKDTPQRPALLKRHARKLRNNFSYVTLTPAGASRIGLSGKRASSSLSGPALDRAIQLAVFCCLDQHRRHRLERRDLVRAFSESGTPPDNIFHVATHELTYPAILRAVFATTADRRQIDRLARHVNEARKNASIRSYLEAGDYGFAVLVPWPDKIELVRELIRDSSLAKDHVFIVGLGPNNATLHSALQQEVRS
jgi:hypothetical protein